MNNGTNGKNGHNGHGGNGLHISDAKKRQLAGSRTGGKNRVAKLSAEELSEQGKHLNEVRWTEVEKNRRYVLGYVKELMTEEQYMSREEFYADYKPEHIIEGPKEKPLTADSSKPMIGSNRWLEENPGKIIPDVKPIVAKATEPIRSKWPADVIYGQSPSHPRRR